MLFFWFYFFYLVLIKSIFALNAACEDSESSWDFTPTPLPNARGLMASVTYNNSLYILGGNENLLTFKFNSTDVLKYDIGSQNYTYLATNINDYNFTAYSQNSIIYQDYIYIFGAYFFSETTRTIRFNLLTNEYEEAESNIQPPIDDLFSPCVYFDKTNLKVYLIGGALWNYTVLDSVLIYDLINQTWTYGPSLLSPRHRHICEVLNDNIYIIGGANAFYTQTLLQTIEKWDYKNSSNSWELVDALLQPGRIYMKSLTIDDEYIFLSGGYTYYSQSDQVVGYIQSFSKSEKFTNYDCLQTSRDYHIFFTNSQQNKLYVTGGASNYYYYIKQTEMLDISFLTSDNSKTWDVVYIIGVIILGFIMLSLMLLCIYAHFTRRKKDDEKLLNNDKPAKKKSSHKNKKQKYLHVEDESDSSSDPDSISLGKSIPNQPNTYNPPLYTEGSPNDTTNTTASIELEQFKKVKGVKINKNNNNNNNNNKKFNHYSQSSEESVSGMFTKPGISMEGLSTIPASANSQITSPPQAFLIGINNNK